MDIFVTYHAIARLRTRAMRSQPIRDFRLVRHLIEQGDLLNHAPRWLRRSGSRQQFTMWNRTTDYWLRLRPIEVEIRDRGVVLALPRDVCFPIVWGHNERFAATTCIARQLGDRRSET